MTRKSPAAVRPKAGPNQRKTPCSISSSPGFPFLSLPIEIQQEIFNLLRDPPLTLVIKYNGNRSSICELEEDEPTGRGTTRSFLLTGHAIYDKFSAMYWQTVTVLFTDPIELANKFLASASLTAYSNLRHLRYIINADEQRFHDQQSRSVVSTLSHEYNPLAADVKKLAEALLLYKELEQLEMFHIQLYPGANFNRLSWRGINGLVNVELAWTLADRLWKGCFAELRRIVLKKTFNGFQTSMEMTSTNAGVHPWVMRMDMLFKKMGST